MARAEHAAWQGALGHLTRRLGEDAVELVPVDGNGQGLTQLAVFELLLGRVALAHHRVQPVEAHVAARQVHRAGQQNAFAREVLVHRGRVFHLDAVGVAVAHLIQLGHIEVALAELGVLRHRLFFHAQDQGVDEGRLLAAVIQAAFQLVLGHAFTGVGLATVVGVALEHVAAVLNILGHHVGARAHGPGVERQALAGHAGLGIKGVGLPGNGRQKGHGHPVLPLRILAFDAQTQGVLVHGLRARQGPLAEVQERLVTGGGRKACPKLLVFSTDELAVVRQAHHVFGKHAKHRRGGARGGVALEGVDVILGHQLARAGALELPGRSTLAQLTGLHVVVEVFALRILGKSWVRLVQDAGLDLELVDALGNLIGGRIKRQWPPGVVHIPRRDHGLRGLGHQGVGPLEVVVAVERLVDLVGERGLVAAVGRDRIQVTRRALVEGRVQGVGAAGAIRIGAVVAPGEQGQRGHHPKAEPRQPMRTRKRRAAMHGPIVGSREVRLDHHKIRASRPCTTNWAWRPTGRQTLVGTCPNGRPVKMGTGHTLRRCSMADLRV